MLIGAGAIAELAGLVEGQVVIVQDLALPPLALPGAAVVKVAAGEDIKSWDGLRQIVDSLEAHRLGRDGTVVALGGGTIGDAAGFAASIWQRGVALINVPTTLLAMVDSAIGGKTGINSSRAKNAIGSFWQPRAVLCDLDWLDTLPEAEKQSGYAEIVKYTMTLDPGMADVGDFAEVVERSVRAKAEIVAADERESGLREVLNYGHTAGHAIEALSGYTLAHGRAVAAGMRVAARISQRVLGCPAAVVEQQDRLLAAHGLPGPLPDLAVDRVLDALPGDKKARAGRPRWVLLRDAGRPEPGHEVPEEIVREAVAEILSGS